jgi:hypothetical protein
MVGIAFAAVQPPGVAQYQTLATLQPEGFHVLADNGAQQRNGGSGAGGEPGEVIEPEPEACPLRPGRLADRPEVAAGGTEEGSSRRVQRRQGVAVLAGECPDDARAVGD